MRGLRQRRAPDDPIGHEPSGRAPVLILSASMGAGHDGAAREMAARLRAGGHPVEVRDLLDAAPLRIGHLLRRGYEVELRHAPGAYDATYRLWYRVPWLCPAVAWLVCLLTRRRVLRWVRRTGAGVVVSTYPLATLCLGRLRAVGRLRVPAVNFITDFGVHPLWVHKGIDVNLAVHHEAAEMAERRTGRSALACGPMVADAFDPAVEAAPARRLVTRARVGLRPDDVAVLVVAGSWGIGRVEDTVDAVSAAGRYVPVVVCGHDRVLEARLRHRAERHGGVVVIGWTDQMPALMGACDVLLENAGGLTSLEAMRMGLPVVSYDPIAGHGKENTAVMAACGVSRAASSRDDLRRALDVATTPGRERDRQVAEGLAMFRSDAAALVSATTSSDALAALPGPRRARVVWSTASRTAIGLGALVVIGWGGITTGVDTAASSGAGVAAAATNARDAYVGVRLDAAELADPAVRAALGGDRLSVVVDGTTAEAAVSVLREVVASGGDVESGGHGSEPDGNSSAALWTRAARDAEAGPQLERLTGRRVRFVVPGRRINGFDLIEASRHQETIVVPRVEIVAGAPTSTVVPTIEAGAIVVIDGQQATPAQVLGALHRLQAELAADHLVSRPLSALP